MVVTGLACDSGSRAPERSTDASGRQVFDAAALRAPLSAHPPAHLKAVASAELVPIRLPDGFRIFRWLVPGEIVDLPWSLVEPEYMKDNTFPVIYQGEPELDLAGLGPLVLSADRPLVGDLRGLPAEASTALLARNAKSLSTVILPSGLLGDARLREALVRLSAAELYLSIEGSTWNASSLSSIAALGSRVIALDLDLGARRAFPDPLRVALDRLRHLRLSGSMLSNPGIARLARLIHLRSLSLGRWYRVDPKAPDTVGLTLKPLSALGQLDSIRVFEGIPVLTCEQVSELPRVRSLEARGKSVCEEPLAARHGALRHLRLDVPGLPVPQLRLLSRIERLETLVLAEAMHLGRLGLETISGLQHLRMVHLANGEEWDAGITAPLGRLRGLRFLVLEGARLDDPDLDTISRLEQLRGIELGRVRASPSGLGSLIRLSRLEHLVMKYGRLTPAHHRELARLPALRSLEVREARTTDADLAALDGATRLVTLVLRFAFHAPEVTDAGAEALSKLSTLRALKLGSANQYLPRFGDRGARHLARLEKLEALWLPRTRMTDAGLRDLAALTHLRSLAFDSDRVTDLGVAQLVQLQRLHRLEIGLARLTDASVPSLARLTNLGELILRRTSIPPAAVDTLRARLPGCRIRVE
jgi:hypothetical protein